MNVLTTAYPEASLWNYTVELVRGLEREGAHVVLAVMDGPLEAQQRAQLRTFRNVEFYESTYRAEWNDADEREIEAAGSWLLELERRYDIDVVHLNEFSQGARAWRSPPVVTVHHKPAADESARVRACVAAAGILVTPSRALLYALEAQFGRIPCAAVIPLGRSKSVFANRSKEPLILTRGEYGDGGGNVGALARVAARLSWPVFIIGDAPGYTHASMSLANSHFLGVMADADAAAVIMRAGVFAQPVAVPDDGYCIVDAALCGCALVLADLPELREQWDGAATFVVPNDDESLRSTLIWLMSDAEARTDLGSRARYRAASFTAEKMASAYLTLYIDLTLGTSTGLRHDFVRNGGLDRSA